jgi:hypothetical protein
METRKPVFEEIHENARMKRSRGKPSPFWQLVRNR